MCGLGLQAPPALAVPLLQSDVQTGGSEGIAAQLRLDQIPESQEGEYTGQIVKAKRSSER